MLVRLKDRWLEAEEHILKNNTAAANYIGSMVGMGKLDARNILKEQK